MTTGERLVELSSLSTGTAIEHLQSIVLGVGTDAGGIVYEVEYVPIKLEQIQYKVVIEEIEYIENEDISVTYVPRDIVEISLEENYITIEMVSPAQIEVTYEPDTNNN